MFFLLEEEKDEVSDEERKEETLEELKPHVAGKLWS